MFTTNPITGQVARVGSGGQLQEMDFDANGTLYASDGGALYTVDLQVGSRALVGSFGVGQSEYLTGLSFDSAGNLWGCTYSVDSSLFRIDKQSGVATLVGPIGQLCYGIEFGPDGTLYGAFGEIFSINPATGRRTGVVVPYVVGRTLESLDSGIDGTFRAISVNLSDQHQNPILWDVNIPGGGVDPVGTINEHRVFGLASIPSPPTLLSLAAILLWKRCRDRVLRTSPSGATSASSNQ